jgi:hypothetical protein
MFFTAKLSSLSDRLPSTVSSNIPDRIRCLRAGLDPFRYISNFMHFNFIIILSCVLVTIDGVRNFNYI